MSLFYCVVLKHSLIKPLWRSLLTCNFSFLWLCLPLLGSTCSTLDVASKQGPYFRKLVLLYKKRLYTHKWFCKPETVWFHQRNGKIEGLKWANEMHWRKTCLLLILSIITAEFSDFEIWLRPSGKEIPWSCSSESLFCCETTIQENTKLATAMCAF